MKHWIVTIILLPLFFAACGGDKKNNSPQQVAVVPPPAPSAHCIDGSIYCNSNYYRRNPGYTSYPYNPYYYGANYTWNYFGGGSYGNFCNCPSGHRPVYNGSYGLGCVAVNTFQPYAYGAVYWGWGANNNQWVNINQVSNVSGYPQNNRCFQNVAQSCFVDQINSCGAGALCQPTSGGSRLGICVVNGTAGVPNGSMGGYR